MASQYVTALFALLTLSLFIGTGSATVDYYLDSCENTTHQLQAHIQYNETANNTIGYDYTACAYGCDSDTGACALPVAEFEYNLLILLVLAAVIGALLYMIKIHDSDEGKKIRWLYFGVALILMYYLIGAIGVIGQEYASNETIGTGSELILEFTFAFGWVLFFIFAYYILMFLVTWLRVIQDNKKKEDDW